MKSSIYIICICMGCSHVPKTQTPDQDGGLLEINGAELFVKSLGNGEPVLVIHGGPGFGHQYLQDHLSSLEDSYRLIYYDQRASGMSSADLDSSQLKFEHFVQDIEGIRTYLGIDRLNIIAHSFGGLLGMKYAIDFPDHVNKLVLIGSISANSEINNRANTRLANSFSREDLESRVAIIRSEAFRAENTTAFEDLLNIGFKYQFCDTLLLDQLVLNLPTDFFAKSQVLQILGKDLSSYNFSSDLNKVTAPVLLIYGGCDPLTSFAKEEISTNLRQVEEVVLSQSGHFPFIEEKQKTIEEIKHFFNR